MINPPMATTKIINVQDSILNQARKDNVPVIIHLITGFQLRGWVKGFDNFTVILQNDGRQSLVYKHAISTVTPLPVVSHTPGACEASDEPS